MSNREKQAAIKHPMAGDRWMTARGVRTITAVCMNALNSDRDDIRYTRIDGVKCKCSGRTFRRWARFCIYLGVVDAGIPASKIPEVTDENKG